MLKQYRAAVIGVVCMMAAILVTGLISLKDEKPTEDTNQKMAAEQTTSADKEQLLANPVLALAGGVDEQLPAASGEPETAEGQDTDSAEPAGTPADGESGIEADTDAMEPDEIQTGGAGPEPDTEGTEPAEAGPAEPEETEEPEAGTSEFDGYVLPVVDVYLNIRDTPSQDGAVLGKLYVGSMAKIVETEGDWTRISSGSVEGYVSNDYIVTGAEAEEIARRDGKIIGTVLEGGLRVRENPGTDADVLSIAGEGEQFEVAEELEGWVGVRYSEDTVAYLSADYVTVDFELGEAVSIEEELEAIRRAEEEAARKAAEAAKAQEEAMAKAAERLENSKAIETITSEGYEASYDDTYLLACLVHMESGSEPYEGKLAVANVVLNRLKCGYGSTISEVIYAKGQFTGANTGALASRLAKGPNDESMQAAAEALSGVNNIGDYRNFISLGWANCDSYSEYTIIGNHCFYKR